MELDRKHFHPLSNPPGTRHLKACSARSGSEGLPQAEVSGWSAHLERVDTAPIVPTEYDLAVERFLLDDDLAYFIGRARIEPEDNGLDQAIGRAIRDYRPGADRLLLWMIQH